MSHDHALTLTENHIVHSVCFTPISGTFAQNSDFDVSILLPVSSVGCITTLWLATKVNVTHGLAVLSECLGRVTRQICLSLFCRRVSADVMRSIHAQFKQSTPVYNMYFRMQIGQDDVCKT